MLYMSGKAEELSETVFRKEKEMKTKRPIKLIPRKTPIKDMIRGIRHLTQDERNELQRAIWDYDKKIKPRFSCKRGDVIRFWSEWTDFSKGIFKDRIERIGIALGDYDNTDDALCLEYMPEYKCWRTEPVRGDKFIEIIGHVDLTEWETMTDRLWAWRNEK